MTGITGRNDIYKSRFFEQEPMEQLIIPGWKSQEYIKVQVGRYLRPCLVGWPSFEGGEGRPNEKVRSRLSAPGKVRQGEGEPVELSTYGRGNERSTISPPPNKHQGPATGLD